MGDVIKREECFIPIEKYKDLLKRMNEPLYLELIESLQNVGLNICESSKEIDTFINDLIRNNFLEICRSSEIFKGAI